MKVPLSVFGALHYLTESFQLDFAILCDGDLFKSCFKLNSLASCAKVYYQSGPAGINKWVWNNT